MAVIGIDLGTTNSLACVWKDNKTVLIPDATGDVLTPSVVSIDKNEELLVGKAAKECLISKPEQTVCKFKRFMGTDKKYRIGRKVYTPEDLSAMVLRKLKRDAEIYLGEEVTEAVISVPAYFNNEQRAATRRAGQLAGLKTERLVNEPSAAALACQTFYPEDEATFLVIDFGGGTLDVSLVECFEQIVNILAVSGDNHLGGIDFDIAIAEHFCKENRIDFKELSAQRREIILKSAELAKITLTEKEEAEMKVRWGTETLTLDLSREGLIRIAAPVFERFLKPIDRVLKDGDTDMEDIQKVVLVGGSCKMPVVEMYVRYVLKKKPIYLGSPDTIVAQGVGAYAGIKERKDGIKDMLLTDICPFSLGTAIHNKHDPDRPEMSFLIERNTPLPAARSRRYVTARDFQRKVECGVYQGEEYYAEDNVKIAELEIKVPPRKKGKEEIDIQFIYDINGLLEVIATVCSTGEKKQLVVNQGSQYQTKEQLDKRVKELEAVTMLPQDKEENRILIEKAESLYAQLSGKERESLAFAMENFHRMISGSSLIKTKKAREELEETLQVLENYLYNFSVMEEEISSDWYKEIMREEQTDDEEDNDFWFGGGMTH